MRPLVIVALAAGLAATIASPARAARVNVSRELAYLASAQDSDGGFGAAPGQASSELYTGWAAIGLAAGGRDPASVRRDGHSVLYALGAQAGTLEGLLRYRDSDGSFADQVNLTAFAIFALRAAGIAWNGPTVGAAGRWLARQQNADGGFSFATHGSASDVDDTAAALQGLIDSGAARSSAGVQRAVAYIERAQNLEHLELAAQGVKDRILGGGVGSRHILRGGPQL